MIEETLRNSCDVHYVATVFRSNDPISPPGGSIGSPLNTVCDGTAKSCHDEAGDKYFACMLIMRLPEWGARPSCLRMNPIVIVQRSV